MPKRAAKASVPAPIPASATPEQRTSGEGVDLTSQDESASPKMPHERDERVGMTGGAQSSRVQQGARDLKRGLQDTSRATEADRAYKKLKK